MYGRAFYEMVYLIARPPAVCVTCKQWNGVFVARPPAIYIIEILGYIFGYILVTFVFGLFVFYIVYLIARPPAVCVWQY